MNDILLAIVLFGLVTFLAFWAAKKLRVSILPFVVIAPVLIAIGLTTQIPSSPYYSPTGDGSFYQKWGFAIAESWRNGEDLVGRTLWPGKGFWPLVIAV